MVEVTSPYNPARFRHVVPVGRRAGKTREEVFLSKLGPPTDKGCREWTAHVNQDGYGRMNVMGRLLSAHRVSYALHYGEPPQDKEVMHTCDNPGCCEPSHLTLGTHTDNMQDCLGKGRTNKTKLRPEQVVEVRRMLAEGVSQTQAAKKVGVTPAMVSRIHLRKAWKHL